MGMVAIWYPGIVILVWARSYWMPGTMISLALRNNMLTEFVQCARTFKWLLYLPFLCCLFAVLGDVMS